MEALTAGSDPLSRLDDTSMLCITLVNSVGGIVPLKELPDRLRNIRDSPSCGMDPLSMLLLRSMYVRLGGKIEAMVPPNTDLDSVNIWSGNCHKQLGIEPRNDDSVMAR